MIDNYLPTYLHTLTSPTSPDHPGRRSRLRAGPREPAPPLGHERPKISLAEERMACLDSNLAGQLAGGVHPPLMARPARGHCSLGDINVAPGAAATLIRFHARLPLSSLGSDYKKSWRWDRQLFFFVSLSEGFTLLITEAQSRQASHPTSLRRRSKNDTQKNAPSSLSSRPGTWGNSP